MENLVCIDNKFDYSTFVDKFFEFLDVQSKDTVRTYKNGISNFIQYLQDNNISNPTRNDVVNWKLNLKQHSSSSTVNTYLVSVKALFNFLEMYGLYSNISKYVKGFNVSTTPKKNVLTEEQIRYIYNNLIDKREKAIFGLLVTTGMRGIEIANAKIENIKMINDEYCLFIKPKGHSEYDEYCKLSKNIFNDILDYIGDRKEGYIFTSTSNNNLGEGMTILSFRRIFKSILKRFGINDETISLHGTRRTFATLAYNNGATVMQIQQCLHHISQNTTLRYLKCADRNNNNAEQLVADIL